MLSQTSEHALRAILFLAERTPGEPVPADMVAEALDAPRNYLAKTLQLLARRGILGSLRGPGGGFWLRVAADRLTLAQVIEPFDEPRQSGVCLLGGRPCDDAAPCAAHQQWKGVAREMWAPLHRTTVADLIQSAGITHQAVKLTA